MITIIFKITLTQQLIFILLLFVPLIGCRQSNAIITDFPDKSFDFNNWRKDSTGCSHYREMNYLSLLKQNSFFIGHSRDYIIQLLGKPSLPYKEGNNTTLLYTIECMLVLGRDASKPASVNAPKPIYSAENTSKVIFYLKNYTCTSVGAIDP